MSKTKHNFSLRQNDFRLDNEDFLFSQAVKEDRRKKKMKRLQHAAKTKNVDKLDDYDEYDREYD